MPGITRIASTLYRLETIAAAVSYWKRPLTDWLAARRADLLNDPDEIRRYAIALITAGDGHAVDQLPLGDNEKSWLAMHAQRMAGDWEAAAMEACRLPSDRYPDQYLVLLQAVVEGVEPGTLIRDRLVEGSWNPAANLVSFLIGEDHSGTEMVNVAEGLVDARFEPAPDGVLHAVDVISGRSAGTVTTAALTRLVAHESVVDDFIDSHPDRIEITADAPPLLIARVDPSSLSDEALRDLGHHEELARRAYFRGQEVLGTLPDNRATRHFRALAGLRDGGTFEREHLADPTAVAAADAVESGEVQPGLLDDSTVWPLLDDLIDGTLASRHPKNASGWYLRRALAALWEWDVTTASSHAKRVLQHSDDETQRDEALNILAYTRYIDGRDEDAIVALEQALAGEYSANLQTNIGVIAEALEPNKAAAHLAAMASEAPTLELKLAAARRAFSIWDPDHPIWEDEDDATTIPSGLRNVLRELAVAQTSADDHRWVVQLLSFVDKEWLAEPRNLASSPNVGTVAHRFYVARAASSPDKYIAEMVAGLEAEPDADWLRHERDQMVDSLRAMIFSEDGGPGPAMFAFEAVSQGLPMEDLDRIVLIAGSVVVVCQRLAQDKSEPADKILELLREARRTLSTLDPDTQDRLEGLVDMADDRYAAAVAIARQHGVSEAAGIVGQVESKMAYVPRRQINMQAVREMLDPIKGFLQETVRALDAAAQQARDPEIKEGIREMRGSVQEFLRGVEGLMR